MVVAATVCGSVVTMTMKISHPLLAANDFVRTPFVDKSLPRTVNIYVYIKTSPSFRLTMILYFLYHKLYYIEIRLFLL
jgi:hypothetical protein